MNEPFGFLLVTIDPPTTRGGSGLAWNLVEARIEKGMWPIYANTRNRRRFEPGKRLAFYVGGARKHAGEIVATAVIRSIDSRSGSRASVDPDRYLTDLADQVLRIEDVQYLDPPVLLKAKIGRMSFAPANMTRWGVVLMGGCRALSEADWGVLFAAEPPKSDTPDHLSD